jgi:ankyrin repeat protein
MSAQEDMLNAAFTGNLAQLKSLHEKHSNINLGAIENQFGYTLLHFAAHGGHADVVTFLVDEGVFLNPLTPTGDTPLNLAAVHEHIEVGAILFQHGAIYENPAPANNIVFNNAVTNHWHPTHLDGHQQYFIECEGVGEFHYADFM